VPLALFHGVNAIVIYQGQCHFDQNYEVMSSFGEIFISLRENSEGFYGVNIRIFLTASHVK